MLRQPIGHRSRNSARPNSLLINATYSPFGISGVLARCQPSSRHGPARAVPAPPSARGVPDTGVSARATSQAPTSALAHEGPSVGRGARPARPSGLTHQVRLSDVPRRGRAAEDVGPYHRSRPPDRSPPQPTDHRPVRYVIRPCSRRGFGDERDFTSERSEVKSRIGPPVCACVKKGDVPK